MRDILFRGKRKDNGLWVYGDLRQYSETHKGIYDYDLRQTVKGIIPETVGQYTGLTDKNGKKIFEGDVVTDSEYGGVYSVRYFGDNEYPAFDVFPELETVECNGLSFLSNVNCLEVIGNIHDNPELLN